MKIKIEPEIGLTVPLPENPEPLTIAVDGSEAFGVGIEFADENEPEIVGIKVAA